MFDFNRLDFYRDFMIKNSVISIVFHSYTNLTTLTTDKDCVNWILNIEFVGNFKADKNIHSDNYEVFRKEVYNYCLNN